MRAVIFANGELQDRNAARSLLRPEDTILCADGGTRHALAFGLKPDLVVGDLDSLSRQEIGDLTESDVQIDLYPSEKDETDLSLAIKHALELGCGPILIMGGLGGRLDQTLANVGLLADPAFAAQDVRLDDGLEEVIMCRDHVEIHGTVGEVVSLIPWSRSAGGIRTENLQWPLRNESLELGSTRGISNIMAGDRASVSIVSGVLLVVHRRGPRGASVRPDGRVQEPQN